MNEFDIFYFKTLSALEKVKSKRSLKERTIFDFRGKFMRRKLEKGYISGVNSAIRVLKNVKKEVDSLYETSDMEHTKNHSLINLLILLGHKGLEKLLVPQQFSYLITNFIEKKEHKLQMNLFQ